MRGFFFFLIQIVGSVSAAPLSCPSIRLQPSFFSVKPSVHGPLPFCYGWTAATLVDAFANSRSIQSLEKTFETFPLQTALASIPKNLKIGGGGTMADAATFLEKAGSCDLKDFEGFLIAPACRDDFFSKIFEAFSSPPPRFEKKQRNVSSPKISVEGKQKRQRADQARILDFPFYTFVFKEIFKADKRGEFSLFLMDLLCNPSQRKFGTKWKSETFSFPGKKNIVEILEKNEQPLGLGVCYQFLVEGKSYRGLAKNQSCRRHTVAVLGMDRKNGGCQALVRNPYTADCRDYKKAGWFCEPKTGDVWVDLETLAANSYELFYLHP